MRDSLTGRARAVLRHKFVQDVIALQLGRFGAIGFGLLSTLVVTRVVGPVGYGIYGLANSILSTFGLLNISGAGQSTATKLPKALAVGDAQTALDVMAYHVQVSLLLTSGIALLMLVLAPAYAALTQGNATIGWLAAVLAFTGPADATVVLVNTSLQSKRQMRTLGSLITFSQLVLSGAMITLVLISPTPEALIAARLLHSFLILTISVLVYGRLRTQGEMALPPLRVIFARALTISPRPYWRFGVANAVDKNLAAMMTQIPLQLVGMIGGPQAAGYLGLGLRGYAQVSVFTSAMFDAMQAVVPRAVARAEYALLWRSLWRVTLALGAGSLVVYGAMALMAPLVIGPLFGPEWIPAIPAVVMLAYYGGLTTTGGVFGPVYRALGRMRMAISAKLIAFATVLPLGVLVLQGHVRLPLEAFAGAGVLFPAGLQGMSQASAAAAAGGLVVNLLYTVSVGITAATCLWVVRRKLAATRGG